MKKLLMTMGLASAVASAPLCADSLSNSLNNMLDKKDSTGMVNLNGIGVGAKPKRKALPQARKSRPSSAVIGHYNDGKPVRKKEANKYLKKVTKGKINDLDLLPKKQRILVLKDLQRIYAAKHFKSRPGTAIVATVNGHNIYKKEADSFLKRVTGGRVKDFDRLEDKQRLVLIQDLARPIVLKEVAEKELTEFEKEKIFSQMWLEKERQKIEVSNDEMLALYEAKKAKALQANPNAEIPPYISIGESLKNEIIEMKMTEKLMQDVNITVNEDVNESVVTGDINTSSDSNQSLDKMSSNTKETE